MTLEKVLFDDKDVNLDSISSDTLAFIGDSLHSLYVKTRLIISGEIKPGIIHEKSKKLIISEAQAKALENIFEMLTESEKALINRAMNSKGAKRYGNNPDYRKSTAFEALIGYLYLTRKFDRIKQLLEVVERCFYMEKKS